MTVGTLGSTVYQSTNRRRGRRWVWWVVAVIPVLLLLGGAGYAVAPLRHPLPPPTVERVLPATYRIPGTPPALPWPGAGQAVVDVDGVGRLGTSGQPTPVPIASVAKIMTSYLVLVDHPLGATE